MATVEFYIREGSKYIPHIRFWLKKKPKLTTLFQNL